MAKKRRKPRPRRPPAASGTAVKAPQPVKAKEPVKTKAPRAQVDDQRPPAPWGSFPLVEIVVLVALVMLVAGFFSSGSRGPILLGTGLALGSLAGLELSIREHFAGYRSHTMLLAGSAGVATLAFLYYGAPDLLPPAGRFAVAGVVTAAAVFGLARAFRARAGRLVKLR